MIPFSFLNQDHFNMLKDNQRDGKEREHNFKHLLSASLYQASCCNKEEKK